jgi:bifunctional UDP-N-acetylglucosamine pyrophosphorylase/glucosamine-1-phosphate N-acetyltransferase
MNPRELFDVGRVSAPLRDLLDCERPWHALRALDAFCGELEDDRTGWVHPTAVLEGPVVMARDAVIGPHAYVQGPVWIGSGAQIGHGAMLRGNVVVGPGAKVGHATEVKRSILFDDAKAPHFNYVGDSVLGVGVNLGAGVKLANFRADGGNIAVGGESTGLRKLGAMLGDGVCIGCHAVLNPGTVVGCDTVIYPGAVVHGVIDGQTMVKVRPSIEWSERKA